MHNNKMKKMQNVILRFRKNNLTKYPWRKTSEPYNILISELLLQKTDAKKVSKVYLEFIKKWPTISQLYLAKIEDIEKIIKYVGLFYRAKRIKGIAEQIVHVFQGKVPNNKKELLALHGVGNYIANAVLCFAYQKRVPIVDTNVWRVYSRVFSLQSSKSRAYTDPKVWDFAESILPSEQCVEYNYALLDFASLVCRAKRPVCNSCEANTICNFCRHLKI